MIELAESLGLSTTEEGDQVDTLNKVMRYLGVSCRHSHFPQAIHQMTVHIPRLVTKAYRHELGCC